MAETPYIRGCPFCGTRRALVVAMSGDAMRISCSCGASGPVAGTFIESARLWNRRAAEEPKAADQLSQPAKGVC